MKLHPEDPRLTAFLLGELPAADAAAVERAIAADPALQIALREIESVQILLTDTLSTQPQSLLPRQRNQILLAARQAEQSDEPIRLPSHRASHKPMLVPLAAAAIIALGIYVLILIPSPKKGGTTADKDKTSDEIPMEIALLPAPGPADTSSSTGQTTPAASGDTAAAQTRLMKETGDDFLEMVQRRLASAPPPAADQLPALRVRGSVSASHHPTLALPVQSGRASLGWITHSIRNNRKFPSPNAVRIEEILNHFTIRPTGPAAVHQGVTLSTETLPCPWKPSASLLIVSIRGAAKEAKNITASYQAETSNVWRYRLLGYSITGGSVQGRLPSLLPAGAITTLALEIEPSSTQQDFGSIEWLVNGKPAPAVPVSRDNEREPSDDARFAALLCSFAQWLSGEPSGLVDVEMVAALARELATDAMPADRADLLNLIDQSLHLER
jgi:hypothetical protein